MSDTETTAPAVEHRDGPAFVRQQGDWEVHGHYEGPGNIKVYRRELFREFTYPGYRIWNIAAHLDELIEEAEAAWQKPHHALTTELAELRTAVADIVADLVEMDAETAIVLASWPAACRLVDLAGAWPVDDTEDDEDEDQPTEGNHDG